MSDDTAQESEALIHPGDDGKFWAEVVGLAGCFTQGDNYSQIMARLRDAHELCSRSPAPAGGAPATPVALSERAKAGDLTAALVAGGWTASAEPSEFHALWEHSASGGKLCVPKDVGEALNSGYRAAVSAYLAG